MARASQTTQTIDRDGLEPTMTAPTSGAGNGDIVDCGNTILYVDNGGGSSINVTVISTATQDGLDLDDLVVAVPAGEIRLIGPFPSRTFGQTSGDDKGRAYVEYSSATSVTRAVLKVEGSS